MSEKKKRRFCELLKAAIIDEDKACAGAETSGSYGELRDAHNEHIASLPEFHGISYSVLSDDQEAIAQIREQECDHENTLKRMYANRCGA